MIDPTLIGTLAQKFMEQIEQDYGEDAEIVEALILAEVRRRNEDGDLGSQMSYRCTSSRPVIHTGLGKWLALATEPGESEG